jgi:hypothetical protein
MIGPPDSYFGSLEFKSWLGKMSILGEIFHGSSKFLQSKYRNGTLNCIMTTFLDIFLLILFMKEEHVFVSSTQSSSSTASAISENNNQPYTYGVLN